MKKSLTMLFFMFMRMAQAALITETTVYHQDKTPLEGFIAFDDKFSGQRPGVLIVHDWMGQSEYTQQRAKQLAELGYVALAVDIYGQGVRPTNPKEAAEQAGKYKADRKLLRERVKAGLERLRAHKNVDKQKIAAIGYCFGGTTVLELARSGAKLNGVVSFHGGLSTPTPDDAKNIKTKVLVLHGAIDPNVPESEVQGFINEMEKAKVDYQLVSYGGAVHSFTNPKAGNDVKKGNAYNEKADRRSFQAMQDFFSEIFAN